jgi:hypothetical protein
VEELTRLGRKQAAGTVERDSQTMHNDDEEATNVVGVRRGTTPESLLGRQCRQGSAAPTVGCVFTAPALPTPDGVQMRRSTAVVNVPNILYDLRNLKKKLHFQSTSMSSFLHCIRENISLLLRCYLYLLSL